MASWTPFLVGALIGGFFAQAWYFPSPRQEARAILARTTRDAKRAARVRVEMDRLRDGR